MEKKTIVITGSTRGIGLGLAKEFLAKGHQLVINGRTKEKVDEVVAGLQKTNPDVSGVAGSVSKEETLENLIEHTVNKFGKIDIWINNAGLPQPYNLFVDIDKKDIKTLIDVNIFGSLLGTKLVSIFMIKQGFGKIFNMEGFGSDNRMRPRLTLYGTSKKAINYFSKAFSKELKDAPIQMGVINPGMVRTEFLDISLEGASEKEKRQFEKVYKILAEDVEVVTKYLVNKILKSTKNYNRITFLTPIRLFSKLFRMMINRAL